MTDERKQLRADLVAMARIGWKTLAAMTKAAVRLLPQRRQPVDAQTPPGSPSRGLDASGLESRRTTEARSAVLLGIATGWLLRKILRSLAVSNRPATFVERPSLNVPVAHPNSPTDADDTATKEEKELADCGCLQTGRVADRDLDAAFGNNVARRQRLGTFLVAIAFLASVAGGIGFLVIYWTGGSNELLGGTLAVCLGGMGVAAVVSAHRLTSHKEAVEPREEPSSDQDHEAAAEAFRTGTNEIHRRKLLGWMAAGGTGLLGVMVLSLFRSLGVSPNKALYTTVWKRGQRLMTVDGKPMAADGLVPGTTALVFPEDSIGSEKSQTVLVRVSPDLLRLPSERSQWAPMGNLAYSRVCTHAGCPVGMYETTTHQLMCPCHQSTFDVLNGAQPTGGPAARPLPQLPLYVDADGNLRAASGLSGPPGPGFWGLAS